MAELENKNERVDVSWLDFSKSEGDSKERYSKYFSNDPLQMIPPALLNRDNIFCYISKCSLVYPFNENDVDKIKEASITFTIGEEVLYWDEGNRKQHRRNLRDGDYFKLRPNSITFLRPKERINLPNYIAARFNLRVKHVHKGLLLGTGPLLDPGFSGYPMIPVYNFTDNEYFLKIGEKFINVEFTKVSQVVGEKIGLSKKPNAPSDYTFDDFLKENVYPHANHIKSSLSSTLDEARKTTAWFKSVLTFGSIGIGISIIFGLYSVYDIAVSTNELIGNTDEKVMQYVTEIKGLTLKVEILQDEVNKLK